MKAPEFKVEFNGVEWAVCQLVEYLYNGPGWLEPLYKQIASFATEAAALEALKKVAA